MDDDLIKRLRNCATQAAPCKTCDMTEDGFCSDTLMKQAADAVEELQAAKCPHYIRNVHDRGDDSLCDKFVCEVKSLPRWIPVTERLPEPMKDVVLFMRYGKYKQLSEFAVGYYDDELSDFSYRDVTHWMPLPEPPDHIGDANEMVGDSE